MGGLASFLRPLDWAIPLYCSVKLVPKNFLVRCDLQPVPMASFTANPYIPSKSNHFNKYLHRINHFVSLCMQLFLRVFLRALRFPSYFTLNMKTVHVLTFSVWTYGLFDFFGDLEVNTKSWPCIDRPKNKNKKEWPCLEPCLGYWVKFLIHSLLISKLL